MFTTSPPGRGYERDFGVELNAEDGVGLVGDSGVGRVGGRGDGAEALGELAELVTVAHPVSQSAQLQLR